MTLCFSIHQSNTLTKVHQRELFWSLFIHKKTQKINIKVSQASSPVAWTSSFAVYNFFLASWSNSEHGALCPPSSIPVSGIRGSSTLILNNTGGHFKVKGKIRPVGESKPTVPSTESNLLGSASCRVGGAWL